MCRPNPCSTVVEPFIPSPAIAGDGDVAVLFSYRRSPAMACSSASLLPFSKRHRLCGGLNLMIILRIAVYVAIKVSAAADGSGPAALLTPPLALEGGLAAEHRAPNMMQRVISLFSSVRPGSDLTNFQLPPLFNLPKSQLQCYGEAVYCVGEDFLSRCAQGKNSLERFTSVVAWSISTTRPALFGSAPYNPILGETHHVSNGNLNVLLEQVSHHPPVSALHATDEKEKVELVWWHNPVPKYYGTSVEAVINGKRHLRLLSFGENYEMDSPRLLIKILPRPSADWVGNVKIQCKDSGLEADLCYYRNHSFFGFGGNYRLVKGTIYNSKTLETIYEIDGQWDRIVALKDAHSGTVTVLYDAMGAISKLKTPVVKDSKGLRPTESAVVWNDVTKAILQRDWEKAREAKRCIEERERNLRSERISRGEEVWVPKHFKATQTKDGEFECWPLESTVPPAPISVPP